MANNEGAGVTGGEAAAVGARSVQIAIYTRKSNDENLNGAVTSLDNQKTCARSYIAIQREKGWTEYPEAFDDPAESGKNLKRPAIKRLLKAVEEGRVQGIIVYKLDRLTRNSKDFHYLLELFEKRNVAFISATESIDTKSPQGRLMTAIMVQFAQYDREMDVERSKDFHLARAGKGLWCAGLPPLGYDIKDKLVVNESEADLVRRIFTLYLEHESSIRVAEELNRLGYRRKTYKTLIGKLYGGKPFDMDAVGRTLRRKLYIGLITNERTHKEFPGQHQAIVAPDVFERVQKLLAGHNHRGGEIHYAANRHGFLLKGLIRCGVCGGVVAGYARIKKGKSYRYYKCLAQRNGISARCSFGSVNADKIEEYLIEKLAAVGWDRAFLERVTHKADILSKASIRPLEKEKREVDDRLQGVQREIQGLLNLAKQGGASRNAAEEVGRLEETKRTLEAHSLQLEAQLAFRKRVVYDVDVVQGALQRFARFFNRIPLSLQVQIVGLLIREVLVRKDGIDVRTHELAISDFQRALGGKKAVAFGPHQTLRRREANATDTSTHPQSVKRTAVVNLRLNWRGRDPANATELDAAPVPSLENDQYFPPFSIAWPHGWASIANGEWAIRDHLACSLGDPQIPVGFPSGRQFEYRRLRGRPDLNCRPVGAVSA
ncbi:MAG: hypothetical protein A2040_12995 [Rhodocyclales bacterium GWA2_65_19]|nr:MAG: hypothetical protein A2040_12995 [Rhodocyclales bacterium GWA2_65_19]